ncbi:MAG: hypothetical protein IJD76_03690 [Bacilli bacterium]|nr:hypothetical protein [Bacilli bacterium]
MTLVRKYLTPGVIGILIYLIICLISNSNNYFNYHLIYVLTFSYLLRVSDDIIDYEKDFLQNKTVMSQKILQLLFLILSLIIIVNSIIFNQILYLGVYIFLLIQFLKPQKILIYLKSLITPFLLIIICQDLLGFNIYNIVFIIIILIFDLLLIIRKESYVSNKFVKR